VILGGEDVAAGPANLGSQSDQGLDQHRRLNGHVERASDPRTRQRLEIGVLAPGGHQPRHLVFRQPDLLAAELRQLEVGDFEIDLGGGGAHLVSVLVVLFVNTAAPRGVTGG
jgi:hypothetical protein